MIPEANGHLGLLCWFATIPLTRSKARHAEGRTLKLTLLQHRIRFPFSVPKLPQKPSRNMISMRITENIWQISVLRTAAIKTRRK